MARLLGIDPGQRRVGLAVSDATETIASPLRVVDLDSENLSEVLRNLIDTEGIEEIIVGYPTPLQVEENERTRQVDRFIEKFIEPLDCPYTVFSERYSTKEATRLQQLRDDSQEVVDDEAAAIILQNYLQTGE
ncbi:MAG: Holliday junction resolvase RuvX [bacterium]